MRRDLLSLVLCVILVGCGDYSSVSDEDMVQQAEDDFMLEVASAEGYGTAGKAIQLYRGKVEFVSCSETDQGNDPNVKGTMTITYKLEDEIVEKVWEDSCKFKRVIEHYCKFTTKFVHRPINCEHGCENGACIGEGI